MRFIFKKPYILWFLGIFFLYLVVNVLISGFYDTFYGILLYYKTINWLKLGLSLILTLLVGFFISVNLVYSAVLYKKRKSCKKGVAATGVGGVAGLAVGICPLCVTGLFPLIFSLLGISFSFALLPLEGIEAQILVLVILLTGYYLLKTETFK